ncbi:hypothetical protein ACF0H5_007944 [Mactra antiquata]
MNRRQSNASVASVRRGSVIDPNKAKRVSLKDGTLGNLGRLTSLSEVKEGDIYYKTERIYPRIPDHPEDVIISVARWPRDSRAGSIAGINRDETSTPSEGQGHDRDR